MKLRILTLSTLLLILLLSFTPAHSETEEEVKDRISRFRRESGQNIMKALDILNPVSHPKLVDVVASVYSTEDPERPGYYDPVYMRMDEIMESATGEEVFQRIHTYLEPKWPTRTRKHFARTVGPHQNESTLPFLIKFAKSEKSEEVQFELLRSIGCYNNADALVALYNHCIKSLSITNSICAFQGLKKDKSENGLDLIRKLFENDKVAGEIRGESLLILYNRKALGAVQLAEMALTDKATGVRVCALVILTKEKREDLASKIILLLDAPEWEVQIAAVKACSELKLVKAVEPLINLWKKVGGRVGEEIHKALLKITGKSFGPDYRYWEAWFNNLEEPLEKTDKEGEYVNYHGLKTKSKNIAFVIDHSGSMSEKVSSKAAGGYIGGGVKVEGDTRLAFVKAELIRVVTILPEDAKFNIIAFDDKIKSWNKGQEIANKKNKADAISWIKALTPNGATNIYDALEEAFGRMNPGGKPNKRYKGAGPDTIFLLSDGMPCAGKIQKPAEILKAIQDLNSIRQVTIHTIGVGKATKPLLEPLAAQNNGQFKLIAE